VIAVVVAYLPAFGAGFVWDDEQLVTANPLLRSLAGLAEIWSGGRTADYFPLTNTVFWVEHHLFGDNAGGYHALNIFIQAANALLIWRVLRRLNVPGAWLAGLIFGVHPVHAESVAWISELKNLLALFFALLSVICFFPSGTSRYLTGGRAYAASLFFFLLAVLAKSQVVFLPFALLLCLWWRAGRTMAASFRKRAITLWPFFSIAAALSLITISFQNRGIGGEEIIVVTLPRRLVNAGMAVWWYAAKAFAPARLMSIYPSWRFGPPTVIEWLPLAALIILGALLWWGRNHRTRGAFFVFATFIIALLPTLGFVRMAYLRSGTLVADHLQYFADVPVIGLIGAAIALVWARSNRAAMFALTSLVTLILGSMTTYTFARAAVFHDEETLWNDNLSKNPDAWQAHVQLGQRQFQQQQYREAVFHLERAAWLKPELPDIHNLLGLDYCRLERFEEGIAEYRKALQLNEAHPSGEMSKTMATIRTNLANALTITANRLSDSTSTIPGEAENRYEEAVREYEKALTLQPQHPAIHRNLGLLLAKLGRYQEAEVHLRTTLAIVPDEPAARETLEQIEASRRQHLQ
jgi:Tfp pilus assembly protein PilF